MNDGSGSGFGDPGFGLVPGSGFGFRVFGPVRRVPGSGGSSCGARRGSVRMLAAGASSCLVAGCAASAGLPQQRASHDRRCHCQGQAGATGGGLDREGFHDHRGWRSAEHPARRISAGGDEHRSGTATFRPPPVRAARAAAAVQPTISAPSPGDIRYRDRRLVVLYFDLTAMPPPDQMRAYKAARKFIGEQMKPQDLIAIMTFEGGGVRVKHDFTGDRAAAGRHDRHADLRRDSGRQRSS